MSIPRPKRKAEPEIRAKLVAFADHYGQREQALDELADQLRTDRDLAIRAAYQGGLTMADIASILAMSHQRVSQIIRS